MTYKVKFFVSMAASAVTAVVLLTSAGALSSGDMSALAVFVPFFVLFGVSAVATYYFRSRTGSQSTTERELVDQTLMQIQKEQRKDI